MRSKMQTMFIAKSCVDAWTGRIITVKAQVEDRRSGLAETHAREVPANIDTGPAEVSTEELGLYISACQHMLEKAGPAPFQCSDWLRHDCSAKCEFEQYEKLWICRATGCVHHCTRQLCEYKATSSRVCPISGIDYEEFETFEPRHENNDDEPQVHYPFKGHGLAAVDLPYCQLIQRMITVQNLNARKRKQQLKPQPKKAAKKRIRYERSTMPEVEAHEVRPLCSRLLNEATEHKLGPEDHRRICDAILRCWNLVHTTRHINEHRGHYKFAYHVHSCFYECIDGFITERDEYLPQIPALRDILIRKPLLLKRDQQRAQRLGSEAKRLQLTAAKLTHATRILHMSIAELEG